MLLAAGCSTGTGTGTGGTGTGGTGTGGTGGQPPKSALPAVAKSSASATRPGAVAIMTPALAARYLAIAQPANRQLDHDLDGLEDSPDLAVADADLRNAAATERRFDRQLIALTFPPQAEPIVQLLYRVNQARAALTATAAAATSRHQLDGYQQRLDAANELVEEAVTVIRSQLGLPPPDSS